MVIRRGKYWVILLTLAVAVSSSLAGEKVTLPKSVAASGKKLDKSKFAGRIISYDDAGFELRIKADDTQTVAWSDLDAKTQFVIHKSLLDPKDAAAHVELGRALLGAKDGKDWAEKAFAVALKLDPSLKDQIADVKKDAAEAPTTAEAAMRKSDKKGDGTDVKPKPNGSDEGMSRTGPETVGDIESRFWGAQSEDQQAAAVAELKAFADQTKERLNKPLKLIETNFFLFYSDLDEQEAKNWSGLLDKMYGLMADLFGVDRKTNVWRGKALVFVFRSSADYVKFQVEMHHTDPGGSDGMCHTYGNGMVHIAFYRQRDELQFAHVLVHESSHGFVHRYRTPKRLPSWGNEGLAEWIANRLLLDKRPNRPKTTRNTTQILLRQYRGVGGMFDAEHIDAWQYPVSEMLTTYMIETNKKGYIAFINGVKDGESWDDSLKIHFHETRTSLLQKFFAQLQVKL